MKRIIVVVVALLIGASTVVVGASDVSAQGTQTPTLERVCPPGYIEIPGGNPACARFEFARQLDPACPVGAEGVVETGCYITIQELRLDCPIDGVEFGGRCLQAVDEAPYCTSDGSCYEILARVPTRCPGLTIVVPIPAEPGFACRSDVDLISHLPSCAAGFTFVQAGCYRTVAPGPLCVDGLVLVEGECRLQGGPPTIEPPSCPPAADIVQDGCYRLLSPLLECPLETTFQDAFGRCLLANGAVPGEFACRAGQLLLDGQCLVPFAFVGPFPCEDEYLAGVCVSYGRNAQPRPGVCPENVGVIEDETGCYRVSELLAGGTCERFYRPDPVDNPVRCRQDVLLVANGLACEAGYAWVGNRCAAPTGRSIDPGAIRCITGTIEDDLGGCRKPVASAAGIYVCDDGDSALEGKSCVWGAAPRTSCAGGPLFADVGAGAFFENPVGWAACVGVTTGTSDTTFSPGARLTRAQMATFLWRYAGEPAGAPAHGFVDVPVGAYFDVPVAWLKQQGITTGTSDTTFSPHVPVTRAQMAAFLWRMENEPVGAGHSFVDVPAGAYFDVAVGWMAGEGITTGTSASTFSPQSQLTRGQAVTFLWRLAGEPG